MLFFSTVRHTRFSILTWLFQNPAHSFSLPTRSWSHVQNGLMQHFMHITGSACATAQQHVSANSHTLSLITQQPEETAGSFSLCVTTVVEVSLFIINPDIAWILLLSIRCHRHELSCFNQLLSKMKLIAKQNYTFVQDSYRNTTASASSSVFGHSFSSTSHLASSPVIHLGNHLFTRLIHPYVHTSIVSQPSVREGLPLWRKSDTLPGWAASHSVTARGGETPRRPVQ